MSLLVRIHGMLYRVSLAPTEALEGEGIGDSVVFETLDGQWVGSVPTELLLDLDSLGQRELEVLLRHALAAE